MTRRNSPLLLLGLATTIASACIITREELNYDENLETSPCGHFPATGGCTDYLVCPNGIECTTNFWSGFAKCVPGTITVPMRKYTEGTPNPVTFCCDFGTFNGNHPTATCVIKWDTATGGCAEPEPWPG